MAKKWNKVTTVESNKVLNREKLYIVDINSSLSQSTEEKINKQVYVEHLVNIKQATNWYRTFFLI